MRLKIDLDLEQNLITKDKNRKILSLMKHCLENTNKEYFQKIYSKEDTIKKNFTFSLYMPGCVFEREQIRIDQKKIILIFSTSDMECGINFYNAFLNNRNKQISFGKNNVKISNINIIKEKNILEDEACFKTLSPIVIKEHNGDNKKSWYYSIEDEKGEQLFLENLKRQLYDEFGIERKFDIENIKLEIISNKDVKVKNYGIEVLSNICKFKMFAKSYILDYFYKAGIGSKKSSGFGALEKM